MIHKLANMTIEEIKNGYTFLNQDDKYICNICGMEFQNGEIFRVEEKYYAASKMIEMHMQTDHNDMLHILCSYDKKHAGVTENQKELLSMISSGMTDNEIAKKTGVAPSTIRHQRFVFRERAKQAKLYLAIYELAMQGAESNKRATSKKEKIIDVHKGAKMVDDRYFTTEEEEEKIIQNMFSSLEPLKLKVLSSKEKKKIVILKKISEQFDKNRRYSEKEINYIIKEIYDDFATVRRYLIEYGFMERTNDCREYWLK